MGLAELINQENKEEEEVESETYKMSLKKINMLRKENKPEKEKNMKNKKSQKNHKESLLMNIIETKVLILKQPQLVPKSNQ